MDNNFLSTPLPPDLIDLDQAEAAALAAAARSLGFAVFELDGAAMGTKPELMDHAAARLGFPGDFGRNWDALIDYLGDMATIHKNVKTLVFIKAPEKIGAGEPALPATFREVLGLACNNAREWGKGSVILKFAFLSR
jgi:RNAse (barnase) inhibitor barstar